MMRNFRHWLAAILALLTLCCCAAAEVQLDRSGSISVQIHTAEGVNIKNASVKLYKVGDAVIREHNLCFDLAADFAGSGLDLTEPGDSALASQLEAYIGQAQVAAHMQAATDDQGIAAFAGVEPGLYLVCQDGFVGKKQYFSEIAAFVVAVPMTGEGGTEWNYEIAAQPKVNALPTPEPTPKPTDAPSDPTLPQTGMLRWPVPALGIGGLLLFAIGWVLVFTARKDKNA